MVSVLMAVRLAEWRDLRKVIAGVVQGDALFVGVAGNPAGAPDGAAGCWGFGMRWGGGRGGKWIGWTACIRVRIGWRGRGSLRRSGTRCDGEVGGCRVFGVSEIKGREGLEPNKHSQHCLN